MTMEKPKNGYRLFDQQSAACKGYIDTSGEVIMWITCKLFLEVVIIFFE
jgi:hypothetical protein